MRRGKLGVALIIVGLSGLLVGSLFSGPRAMAQKGREEVQWEYKVGTITYNPGERLTDEQRAAGYQKLLNDQAQQGWEPVGSLLTRNTVQTVGGAVTTRESTSFVAFRRKR